MSRDSDPNRTRARVQQILLCAALAGCIQALPPEAVAAERGEDLSKWAEAPPMKQAIAAARKYWTAQEPGFQEDVRVLGTSTGTFTRPGVEQRAVLFRMSLYPRGFPKKGLAILEGDELVHNVAMVLLADDVDAYHDYDGSGLDALALQGGFGMGGQYTRGETIAAFKEEGLVELGHVETYNDVCGMGRADAQGPTSATITVVPGKGFMIQHFRQATCESESEREPVGEPEPLVLKPDAKNPFEDIPVAAETPFAAGQVWKGQYMCGQGETRLALQITEVRGPRVTAIFEFFHTPSQAEGRFYIHGEYQRGTRQIAFAGGEWIERPPGYVTVGLLGHLDSGERVLAGVVDAPGCGEFVVER